MRLAERRLPTVEARHFAAVAFVWVEHFIRRIFMRPRVAPRLGPLRDGARCRHLVTAPATMRRSSIRSCLQQKKRRGARAEARPASRDSA